MDLATFYALISGTCFTLVGLWWNVLQARADLMRNPQLRRLAGGIYLAFLLPGLMSLFAQINPANGLIWRASFVITSALGIYTTLRLVRAAPDAAMLGPFHRNQWLVSLLYGLVMLLGLFPSASALLGLTALQIEALLLIFLIALAHGLTWELLVEAAPPE